MKSRYLKSDTCAIAGKMPATHAIITNKFRYICKFWIKYEFMNHPDVNPTRIYITVSTRAMVLISNFIVFHYLSC